MKYLGRIWNSFHFEGHICSKLNSFILVRKRGKLTPMSQKVWIIFPPCYNQVLKWEYDFYIFFTIINWLKNWDLFIWFLCSPFVQLHIIAFLLCKCLFYGYDPFLNFLLILWFFSIIILNLSFISQLGNLHLFKVWVHTIPPLRGPWFDEN
jgi:hypothetical protein